MKNHHSKVQSTFSGVSRLKFIKIECGIWQKANERPETRKRNIFFCHFIICWVVSLLDFAGSLKLMPSICRREEEKTELRQKKNVAEMIWPTMCRWCCHWQKQQNVYHFHFWFVLFSCAFLFALRLVSSMEMNFFDCMSTMCAHLAQEEEKKNVWKRKQWHIHAHKRNKWHELSRQFCSRLCHFVEYFLLIYFMKS